MWKIDRRLLYVAIAIGSFGLATLSIVYANAWLLSGLVTVSIACWLTGVLWTIYAPQERRAGPLGALAAGFLYVLLAFGPWFQTNVGPWLLTTRALVAIDANVLGHEQPQAASQDLPTAGNWVYTNGLSNTLAFPQANVRLWSTARTATGVATATPTVAVGQWLFAWCAAAIGGLDRKSTRLNSSHL